MTGAARNVEIKARVASLDAVRGRAEPLADGPPVRIDQDDTFFRCAHGRLKLRDFGDGRGELIHYERPDAAGPKVSRYVRSPTASPATLREALAAAHGVIGRVVKQRLLLLVGRTRVHLDEVRGLGAYVELEVVLRDGEHADAGVDEARRLMAALGIAPSQLVEGAYLDLLGAAR